MYFEKPGPQHTKKTLELALDTVRARGLKHLVVASTTGNTAEAVSGLDIAGLNVVIVTHANGYAENGKNEFPAALREKLEAEGLRVLTATHVFSGAERGILSRFGGQYPVEIIGHALRMLGAGVKVCAEIPVMALDAGLLPYGEQVVAVGGSHRGADTAAIVSPAHASAIFETRIHEIICKPL